MNEPKHKVADRVRVWISQRDDILAGERGTVINVKKGPQDTYYVDVILDSGHRLGHYHEGMFVSEGEWR